MDASSQPFRAEQAKSSRTERTTPPIDHLRKAVEKRKVTDNPTESRPSKRQKTEYNLAKEFSHTMTDITHEDISEARDRIKVIINKHEPGMRADRINNTNEVSASIQDRLKDMSPKERIDYLRRHFDKEDVTTTKNGPLIRMICLEIVNKKIYDKILNKVDRAIKDSEIKFNSTREEKYIKAKIAFENSLGYIRRGLEGKIYRKSEEFINECLDYRGSESPEIAVHAIFQSLLDDMKEGSTPRDIETRTEDIHLNNPTNDKAEKIEQSSESSHFDTIREIRSGRYTLAKNNPNQDASFIYEKSFGIFDGLGSERRQSGDIAATIAKDFIQDRLATLPDNLPREDISEEIKKIMLDAHKEIIQKSSKNDNFPKLSATTGTIARIFGDTIYIAHVGDCRIYRYNEESQSLEHLTLDNDSSNFSEQERRGKLDLQLQIAGLDTFTNSPTKLHPYIRRRNVTKSIGGESDKALEDISIATYTYTLNPHHDMFLFATDGLHDNLSDNEIVKILRTPLSPEESATALVRRAKEISGQYDTEKDFLQRSKPDDITVLIIKTGSGAYGAMEQNQAISKTDREYTDAL